jgi:hypothetical protein
MRASKSIDPLLTLRSETVAVGCQRLPFGVFEPSITERRLSLARWATGPAAAAARSLEPFGGHGRAGVDADESGASGAVVGELVRHAGWGDHDVAGSDGDAFVAELEGEVAFLGDPGLVVGVAVESRAVAGVAVVEDQRDGGARQTVGLTTMSQVMTTSSRRMSRMPQAQRRSRRAAAAWSPASTVR